MRRGIREEQYNNRYTNVPPLVPRYLRCGIKGRLDHAGQEIESLNMDEVKEALALFKKEGVEAVAICMMNAFANGTQEEQAAEIVDEALPDAYLTVSSRLLPSIRFYDRVSTTVLNSYVGPTLKSYLENLMVKLAEIGFKGVLLIMQSNGGVVEPELACERSAMTLLSGPAAGPGAGSIYTEVHGFKDYITATATAWPCPCSRSSPSARAGGRSVGSMKGGSCGWARRARAPTRGPPATAGAERNPPARTRTCCSATWIPSSSPAAR
jgi:N-methylhydantoinase A